MISPAYTHTIPEIRALVHAARSSGQTIGLVPTMGALHAGHARLIEVAAQECDFVVVSIFVNPTQFAPTEDFDRYPRTLDADRQLCEQSGAHALFVPEATTIYPPGFRTFVEVEKLQDALCGASRPGHFRGVCTVVLKLFHIIEPDVAFFGQKDAQQALILTRMVQDLDLSLKVRTVPTVREPDGLALSSRNRYLDPEQRRNASSVFRAIQTGQRMIDAGERDPAVIEAALMIQLNAIPGARTEYARVVSAETLDAPEQLKGPTLIAVAVHFGATRLIDNVTLTIPHAS